MLNAAELTGVARSHIVELAQPKCALHRECVSAFLAMREAALRDGIDVQCRSSFRSFDTQLSIWNAKWRGERTLLARDGRVLQHDQLSPDELLNAILIWSALPGGSRHHWGSDVDLIDAHAIPEGYQVQLVPEEYGSQGIFARMDHWLSQHASDFGFFRPYRTDRGGVSPEPWHFSYAPVSIAALEALTPELLRQTLQDSAIEGKSLVLNRLDEIHQQYLVAVDTP